MIPAIRVGLTFQRNQRSKKKVIVHEGGTSSGKTVDTLKNLALDSFLERGKLYSVVRETTPNLLRGPMNDWETIVIPEFGDKSPFEKNIVKKTWTNRFTNTRVEFLALDKEEKGRGPRRDRVLLNEAQELLWETARQLMRRTRDKIYIDYNPSLIKWWVDTKILTRDDAEIYYSTYKDNLFLSEDLIAEIESDVPVYREPDGTEIKDWNLDYNGDGVLIKGDPYEWGVYGLGRRGSPSEAIYQFVYDAEMPDIETAIGIDFGFEHPMSVMRVGRTDSEGMPKLYIDQLLHTSGLTVAALIERLPSIGVKKEDTLICDNSRPEAIQEIQDAGYNAIACTKGAGSVIEGIDWVKRHQLYFTKRSEQAKIQFQNYRRKKIRGMVMEEPVKHEDDAPDAVRYVGFDTWGRPQKTWGFWGE